MGGSSQPRSEWRVIYRRAAWGPNTRPENRVFQSEHVMRRFVARLTNPAGRPHLSPVSLLRIDRRQVGPWEPTS